MLRHIIWDFDGTLFDTYPAAVRAYAQALSDRGWNAPESEINSLMRRSLDIAFACYRQKLGTDDALEQDFRRRCSEGELEWSKPYPGIPELLRDIVQDGRFNYICTHRGRSLYPLLEKSGLMEYFRDFITDENGFPRKPDPAGVNCLIARYNLNPEEVCMVGDRNLDVMAGKNAGVLGIGFCDGMGEVVDRADAVVHSAEELRAFLNL